MSDFNTPKELLDYLLKKEGNKIVSLYEDNSILGFNSDGLLYDFTRKTLVTAFYLTIPNISYWFKYEPKKWYEKIPEGGVLCWVQWHPLHTKLYGYFVARVMEYHPESLTVRELDDKGNTIISYAVKRVTPLTQAEIQQFALNEKRL